MGSQNVDWSAQWAKYGGAKPWGWQAMATPSKKRQVEQMKEIAEFSGGSYESAENMLKPQNWKYMSTRDRNIYKKKRGGRKKTSPTTKKVPATKSPKRITSKPAKPAKPAKPVKPSPVKPTLVKLKPVKLTPAKSKPLQKKPRRSGRKPPKPCEELSSGGCYYREKKHNECLWYNKGCHKWER